MGISRDSKHKRRATGGKRKIHRKKRKFELGRPPADTKIGAHRVHPVRCRGGRIKYRALRLDTGNFSWPSESVTRKTRVLGVVYNASNNELVRTNTLVKSAIVQIDATPFRQWYEQHYGIYLGKIKIAGKEKTVKTPASKAQKGAKDANKKQEATKKVTTAAKEGAKATKKETPAAKEASKKPATTKKATTATKKDNSKKTTVTAVSVDPKKQAENRKHRLLLSQSLTDQFAAGRLYASVTSRPGQCGRCDGYILEGDELTFYLKKLQKKKGKAH